MKQRYLKSKLVLSLVALVMVGIAIPISLSSPRFAFAAFSPDPSYGNGGKVLTSFGNNSDAEDIALQSDGKAVVGGVNSNGGHYNWALSRYNVDGSLDASFGTNGTVTQDFGYDNVIWSVAIQPNGKIVVSGGFGNQWVVGRYNPDGSPDASFGNNGISMPTTPNNSVTVRKVIVQSDGKIISVGSGNCNEPC